MQWNQSRFSREGVCEPGRLILVAVLAVLLVLVSSAAAAAGDAQGLQLMCRGTEEAAHRKRKKDAESVSAEKGASFWGRVNYGS